MLSRTLAEHPWLTTSALVVAVVLGPIAGAWLVPRPRMTSSLLRPASVGVILFTLLPIHRNVTPGCTVEWHFPRLGAVEVMANVVLFIPAVLLAGVLTRRPWLIFLMASGVSALIEGIQALVTALGRSCSTNDWLANSLGAVLGALLAAVALRLARRCADRRG